MSTAGAVDGDPRHPSPAGRRPSRSSAGMPPATGPRSWPRPATVFDESGVDVCVETIAQRAGVGVGTLYRRFPTKELLIEAVVDEVLRGVLSAADAGRWPTSRRPTGSPSSMRAVGRLQFEHAGCLTRLWNNSSDDAARRDRDGEPGAVVEGPGRGGGATRIWSTRT